MPRFRFLPAVALIGALAGCAPAATTDVKSEEAALMQVSRDWAQAAASGDVERIVSFWSDDAIVMAPGQPAIVGKDAIREYVKGGLSVPGFSITWAPERATVAESGDIGYLVEHNRVTAPDANGNLQTEFGKVVTVWRKDASGTWKCVIDTWNSNPQEQVLSRVGVAARPLS